MLCPRIHLQLNSRPRVVLDFQKRQALRAFFLLKIDSLPPVSTVSRLNWVCPLDAKDPYQKERQRHS